MKSRATAGLIILLASRVIADEPVTNASADAAIGATNAVADQSGMEILRDPFWPVGYEPPPPEPEIPDEVIERIKEVEAIEAKVKWPALLLKGITRAGRNRYMAIVEGVGLVESGQTISLQRGDMLYTWTIDEVSAKGVRFTRMEARPYRPPATGVRTQ